MTLPSKLWRLSLGLGLGLLWALSPLSAWAWGHAGHHLIGSLADELLVGTPAAKQVAQVLGPAVKNLRTAGPWLDCVRDVGFKSPDSYQYRPAKPPFNSKACVPFEGPAEKKRMEGYARLNWHNCPVVDGHKVAGACHRSYHFTNVAVQHDHYARQFFGTREHDVVAAVQVATAVLRTGKPSTGLPVLRDRKDALLLIVHLVGDLHQPLHVGAIYLHDDGTPANPDAPSPAGQPVLDTRGGNQLEVGSDDLHHVWDTIPPSIHLNQLGSGPGLLRRKALMAEVRAVPAPTVPASQWPVQWATDTLRAAPAAFDGLRFTRQGALDPENWVVLFQDASGYDKAREGVQRQQITRAAAHLAALLRNVWP